METTINKNLTAKQCFASVCTVVKLKTCPNTWLVDFNPFSPVCCMSARQLLLCIMSGVELLAMLSETL